MLLQMRQQTMQYSMTESGKWLNDFVWSDVPVEFRPESELPKDVMGMYNFGTIVLRDAGGCLVYIWPTYIHELRHRWQWKRHPIWYLIGKIFFLRFLIENDAYAEEDKAEAWMMTKN